MAAVTAWLPPETAVNLLKQTKVLQKGKSSTVCTKLVWDINMGVAPSHGCRDSSKFIETNESPSKRKEFNSLYKIGLGYQHGRRFMAWLP